MHVILIDGNIIKFVCSAFSLKYAKELVKSISQTVTTSRVKY